MGLGLVTILLSLTTDGWMTRAARRDALISTIKERAATLPPGPI